MCSLKTGVKECAVASLVAGVSAVYVYTSYEICIHDVGRRAIFIEIWDAFV